MAADITMKLALDKTQFDRETISAKRSIDSMDNTKLGKLKNEIGTVGTMLKGAFAFGGAGLLVSGIASAAGGLNDLAKISIANAKITADLNTSLKRLGTTYVENQESIEGFLNGLKGVDDDDAKAALAQLVKGGYDLQEAFRQIPLVLDVAARHFDGNLAPAAEAVTQIFQGNLRTMKSLEIDFVKTGNSILDVENAFNALAGSAAGAHQELLERDPGRLLSITMGNLKDQLADEVQPGVSTFFSEFKKSIDTVAPEIENLTSLAGNLTSALGKGLGGTTGIFAEMALQKADKVKGTFETVKALGKLGVDSIGYGTNKARSFVHDIAGDTAGAQELDANAEQFGQGLNLDGVKGGLETMLGVTRKKATAEARIEMEAKKAAEAEKARNYSTRAADSLLQAEQDALLNERLEEELDYFKGEISADEKHNAERQQARDKNTAFARQAMRGRRQEAQFQPPQKLQISFINPSNRVARR